MRAGKILFGDTPGDVAGRLQRAQNAENLRQAHDGGKEECDTRHREEDRFQRSDGGERIRLELSRDDRPAALTVFRLEHQRAVHRERARAFVLERRTAFPRAKRELVNVARSGVARTGQEAPRAVADAHNDLRRGIRRTSPQVSGVDLGDESPRSAGRRVDARAREQPRRHSRVTGSRKNGAAMGQPVRLQRIERRKAIDFAENRCRVARVVDDGERFEFDFQPIATAIAGFAREIR
jgi:hypothetical protein